MTLLNSVPLLSHVRLSVTPWTAARQASLPIINSWSLLRPGLPAPHQLLEFTQTHVS